ncbi:MAG: hypothetical protein O3B31_13395 [Chloroflexi bacterium]|nr:hypothetical protein [Chloroflexota bacterium]MDA1004316.1 hypothetical protein [Chloroflexota bacterium]
MRIGLDFDGVITDTVGAMVTYAANAGLVLAPRDCIAPHGPAGLEPLDFETLVAATHETDYSLSFLPMAGAVEALAHLAEQHEVVVLTARRGAALDYAMRWSEAAGVRTFIRHFVSSDGHTKAAIAGPLGLDVLVDDLPGNLLGLPSSVRPLLWATDYNDQAETSPRVRRLSNWGELLRLVGVNACS